MGIRGRVTASIAIAVVASLATATARAGPPHTGDNPGDKPPLTTQERSEDVPLDLAWRLLALPEVLVELAFSPVALLVSSVERYRLDIRLYDLLRNDSGTIVLRPDIKFALGDSLGAGATLKLRRFASHDGKIDLGGLIQINGDYELAARYRQSVALLEGRRFELEVTYDHDQDSPFFGLGDDNDVRHILLRDLLQADVTGYIAPRGTFHIGGYISLGALRETLGPGVASGTGSDEIVGETPLPPPPGFDATTNYAHLEMSLFRDTRDNPGKTTTGSLITVNATASASIDGSDRTGGRLTADASWFFSVLPRNRTVVLSAGVGASTQLRPGHDIPLNSLVVLGRKNHLRGYSRNRFIDRLGWWASAEYRYPVWEYRTSGVSLMPAFFVDVGHAGSDAKDVVDGASPSVGIAFRGEHESLQILRIELGVSTEGPELTLAVGKAFP